jgi:phage baseplate assembly protein W
MSFDLKIKNGDLSIEGSGTLSTVSGNSKIRQDIVKILLTKTGENKFHPRYGSDIGFLKIGEVSDEEILEMDIKRSVEEAIKYLISLQNFQSKRQNLSLSEIILDISKIDAERDSADPRLYNIYISVLTQKLDIIEEIITIRIV